MKKGPDIAKLKTVQFMVQFDIEKKNCIHVCTAVIGSIKVVYKKTPKLVLEIQRQSFKSLNIQLHRLKSIALILLVILI